MLSMTFTQGQGQIRKHVIFNPKSCKIISDHLNLNKNTAGLFVSANIATSGLEQRSKMNDLEISMGLARNVRSKLTA